MGKQSEMDTVVKRILPYLRRREYDVEKDLDFETAMILKTRYALGYADILVTCGKAAPQFLIEAKRDSRALTIKDRDQAIDYGRTLKTSFVVVTNGKSIQCFNTKTKAPILWNGKLADKIPSKAQLPRVLAALKTNPQTSDIPLGQDSIAPFRPALPLKQLNALFKRCHNAIRKIEKDEENAFSDFSKLLFLKLLEEKADFETFQLPYSYRFFELADRPANEADQVKEAILAMVGKIQKLPYGDVLADPLKLKAPKAYQYIVKELASVYFADSNLDSKGAAFEYFVRATLKGKKLGQYFTPRPLIEMMVHLCGRDKVVNALAAGDTPRILDPACGTGGFLVYMMTLCLRLVEERAAANQVTAGTKTKLIKAIKESTFFGSDANAGVACAAKMNMIVAGDGHTNIKAEDSLALTAKNWSSTCADSDLILTNPPFGTSENDSLGPSDKAAFPIECSRGQYLFLQKMVQAIKPEGQICTVIDEGVLNVDTGKELRRWLLQNCRVLAVIRLPEETFKPNKINVRASVLYLEKYVEADHDLENAYNICFCEIKSLGYHGSGEQIRNFRWNKFLNEVQTEMRDHSKGVVRQGYQWRAFDVSSQDIAQDKGFRLDLKYWEPGVREAIARILAAGGRALQELNSITTSRGKSPNADLYVDEQDGYATVIKAGSGISKYGEVSREGDFVEKVVYEDAPPSAVVQHRDILLASTGDGTLGKCGLYDSTEPALADGHVTIIRVDENVIDPCYLVDYLRAGFGAVQIQRLYSGSTGLIELTPEHVNSIVVDTLNNDITSQRTASERLRAAETTFRLSVDAATETYQQATFEFGGLSISVPAAAPVTE